MPGSEFLKGDFVVYPAHGVGRINEIELQTVAGHELQVFVINFDDGRMTLRLPVGKARVAGLRKISSVNVMQSALKALQTKVKTRRAMWSRRAQEYELKINSGNPLSIAEVIRELYRRHDQPEPSYSERQMYQAALDRLSRELAVVNNIDAKEAVETVEHILQAA